MITWLPLLLGTVAPLLLVFALWTILRMLTISVEDEEVVALSTCAALRDEGWDAIYSTDAASALQNFSSRTFCAAIVDVGLPDMDGNDLISELRAREPRLPIVICTGFDSHVIPSELQDDPRICVITKPYDEPLLLEKLNTLGVRAH